MQSNIETRIESLPEVIGGRPHIAGTRISVRNIATRYKHGCSAEEIADQLSHLTLAQIYAALSYYHSHRKEIDEDIIAEEIVYDDLVRSHHRTRKTG